MHVKAGKAADQLNVSKEFLREYATRGRLPEGAVLATPGGHHLYDVDSIRNWMHENYKQLTRVSRMKAKATA